MGGLKDEEKRRYVAEMFARIARRYDLMNTLMTAGMHHRWRRRAVEEATIGLRGAALDVATGTGDLALALARVEGVTTVVGLDLVPPMISLAKRKASSKATGSPVHFLVGDALSLPFPSDSFVCVASGFALRNMPNLRASLEEMVRVVQPGGRVTSLEIVTLEGGLFSVLFRLYFHRLVPLVGALISRNRSAYTYLPQSVDRFPTANSVAELLEEVGLQDVGYEHMAFGTVVVHWGTKPS